MWKKANKKIRGILLALMIVTMVTTMTPTIAFATGDVGDVNPSSQVTQDLNNDESTGDATDEVVLDEEPGNVSEPASNEAEPDGTGPEDPGKDPMGGSAGSMGDVEYEYSVHWNNVRTDDYHINDDGKLVFHTVDNNLKTAILEFEFKIQQTDEQTIPAGSVEFRVPRAIFERRPEDGGVEKKYCALDDKALQLDLTGISEAPKPSESISFNYTVEDDYYVLRNFLSFSGPKTLTVEVPYQFRPSRVAGGNLESGVYGKDSAVYGGNYFDTTVDVPVRIDLDLDGKPEMDKTESLALEVHTKMNPVTIKKEANDDRNNGIYFKWQDSWGEKPADAEDYFYVIWKNTLNRPAKSSQPFNVVVGEDQETLDANQGEFIGALGSETAGNAGELWSNGYYGTNNCKIDSSFPEIAAEGWEDRLAFYGFVDKNPTETTWLRDKHPTGGNYSFYRQVYFLTRYPNSLIEEAEAAGVDMSVEGITVTNKSFVTSTSFEGQEATNVSNAATALIIKKPYGDGGTFDKSLPWSTDFRAAVRGGGTRLLQGKEVNIEGNTGDSNTDYSYIVTGSAHSLSGYSDDGIASKPYTITIEDGDAYLSELYNKDDGLTTNQFMNNTNKQVFSKLDENDTAKALHNPVKLDEKATTFKYLTLVLGEYEGANEGGSWSEQSGSTKDYTRIKPINIYVKVDGGKEYKYAVATMTKEGKLKCVKVEDNSVLVADVKSNSKINLPENTTNIKVTHESDFYHCELKVYFREVLKATDQVKEILKGYQDDSNIKMGYFTNIGKYSISDGTRAIETDDIKITSSPNADGNRLGNIWDRSYRIPFIEPTTEITKAQGENKGDVVDYPEKGSQSRRVYILVRNYSAVGGSFSDKEVLAESGTSFHKGAFYDLLPAGTKVDTGSIKVGVSEEYSKKVDSAIPSDNYTIDFVNDWNGSGRTMMIVEYELPDKLKYTGALYRSLQYNLLNTYSNIKDRGADVRNTVAYVNLDAETPTAVPAAYKIAKIKDRKYYEELNTTYGDDILFTEATINYKPGSMTETGLQKLVNSDSSPRFDVSSDAYLGDNYTYKVQFTNEKTTVSDNIVLWDIVDNDEGSEWQGTLDRIDISGIQEKPTKANSKVNCDPVVYVTNTVPTVADLDLNNEMWTKLDDPKNVPADIKAFAVDCRKATDGSDFQLGKGMTLGVDIVMKAPESKEYIGKTAKNIAYVDRRSYPSEPDPSYPIKQLYSKASITLRGPEFEFHKDSQYKKVWDRGTEAEPVEVDNNAGEEIVYKLTVKSTSEKLTYNNIIIEDPIPDGLTIDNSKTAVSVTNPDGSSSLTDVLVSTRSDYNSTVDGQNMTLTISELKKGETVDFLIHTTQDQPVVKSTDYVNQAKITKINNHDEDIDSEITYHHVTQQYKVDYVVAPDPTLGTIPNTPSGDVNPAAFIDADADDSSKYHMYEYEDLVTLKPGQTTNWTTADGTNDTARGTWTFDGWYTDDTYTTKMDDFEITQDTTLYGHWVFEPIPYELEYIVYGDSTWGLPSDSVTPDLVSDIPFDDSRDLASPLTTADTAAADKDGDMIGGTWTFSGWKNPVDWKDNRNAVDWGSDDVTKEEKFREDRVVFGKWEFTPALREYTVNKVWSDYADAEQLRPETIDVQLYRTVVRDGVEVKETVGDAVPLNERNNWTKKFNNLYVNVNGADVKYTVEETAVPDGYDPVYSESKDGKSITITNVKEPPIPPRGEVNVLGAKEWTGDEGDISTRPESIKVYLVRDGKVTDNYCETTAVDNWEYSFTKLPEADADGHKYAYSVYEAPVAGYTPTYKYDEETGMWIIVNKYTPDETNLTVYKSWDDADNYDGLRPESIKIQLLKNGEPEGEPAELNDANNWMYVFDKLPIKDDGATKANVYEVKELVVPGYESDVRVVVDEAAEVKAPVYFITNKHDPEKVYIDGDKTWEDGDDADGIRPDSITIRLLANGEEVDSKTVTAEDEWHWSFADLDKYKAGKEISYTITEDAVEGYTTEIDGYDVTNTHEPTPGHGPKTGDNMPLAPLGALALAALAGIVFTLRRRTN